VVSKYWRAKSTANKQLNADSGAGAPPPVNWALVAKENYEPSNSFQNLNV
jgi:hypothetical protein